AAALSGNAGGQVRVAYAAFGLVLMLAARTATAKRVAFQIFWTDVNLNRSLNLGERIHCGKRGLPTGVGVERTDANQPVHAALTLEMAIGVVPDDAQSGAADARLLVTKLIDNFESVAVLLRPSGIHAHKHLRPVAGFGPTASRLNLQVGIAGVLRA